MSLLRRRKEHDVQQVRKTVEAGIVAARAADLIKELQGAVIDLRETLKTEDTDA